MICGADNWVAMEQYGNSKQEWLKQFLELPNGIPSHDDHCQGICVELTHQNFEQCFSLPGSKKLDPIDTRGDN